jgi:hypothetical protein
MCRMKRFGRWKELEVVEHQKCAGGGGFLYDLRKNKTIYGDD